MLKKILITTICLLNLTLGVCAMNDENSSQDLKAILLDIIAKMKNNNIYEVDKGTENYNQKYDIYFGARRDLMDVLSKRGADQTTLNILVDSVWTFWQDYDLGNDIAKVLPDDKTLILFIENLSREMKAEYEEQYQNVERTVDSGLRRWEDSRDPKILGAILAYISARKSKLKVSDWTGDYTFSFLAKNFNQNQEFISFVWENIPSQWEDERKREEVEKLLADYSGPKADDLILKALADPDIETRCIGIRVAYAKNTPFLRGPLINALKQSIMENLSNENIWRDLLKMLEAMLPDERAVTAFLEILVEKETFWATNILVKLLREYPTVLTRKQWDVLLADIKKKPDSSKALNIVVFADMGTVVPEIMDLLNKIEGDALSTLSTGIAYQKTETLLEFLRRLKRAKKEVKADVLSALQGRELDADCQRQVASFLKDRDEHLVQVAFLVLHTSEDPEIIARLERVPYRKLEDLDTPYFSLLNGLKLDWDLNSKQIQAGKECQAKLVFKNEGYLPLRLPPSSTKHGIVPHLNFRHYADWRLVINEKTYLGPVALKEDPLKTDDNGESGFKPRVLKRHEELEVALELGDILSVLSPGQYKVRLAYLSRSERRHQPHYPDFIIATPEIEVEVQALPEWQKSQDGTIAAINSPAHNVREQGWKNLKIEKYKPQPDQPWTELLQKLSKGQFKNIKFSFRVGQYDQEIRHEAYEISNVIDGKLVFQWSWDEEDIRGGNHLDLKPSEVQEFFRLILAGSPFGHKPLQKYGGAYEQQAGVALSVVLFSEQEGKSYTTPQLWTFELSHHPWFAPWFSQLKAWQEQAKKGK